MQERTISVGRMPVKTWRWLRVNEAELALRRPDAAKSAPAGEIRASGRVDIRQDFDTPAWAWKMAGLFVPLEMAAFIDENANRRHLIRIPPNHAEKEPVFLALHLDAKSPALVDDIIIEAGEGSSATVILQYTSEAGALARHCGRTRVIAHRDANVKLVKVQMLAGDADHSDAIEGTAQENAQLHVILAELGAARPLVSCNLTLEGEGAAAGLDVVYLGDQARSLDITCRVEHRGRKTVSNITGRGVLLEQSKKVFRDTLDFISGAAGAKGREEESVLMLSPRARNVSVPLLLCGEDDVEGEHACSSGRPDGKILFYLMSRGIGELEAKKLLAQASLSSVVEKIPDAQIREAVLDKVRSSIERGG